LPQRQKSLPPRIVPKMPEFRPLAIYETGRLFNDPAAMAAPASPPVPPQRPAASTP
jgi:hypothetical protein